MATTLIDNFSLYGDKPNFARDRVADTKEMREFDVTTKKYDYGHIVFCKGDGKHYRFMYNYDAPDEANYNDTTGWFQEFTTGGSEGSIDTSDFATKIDLESKQDVIGDLAAIRSGAAKGATAVQEIEIVTDEPITTPSNGRLYLGLATVAKSGSYNDLNTKPEFKTINGESIIKSDDDDSGNIQITGGDGSVDLSGYVTDAELAEALKSKVDTEKDKGLSTNDFTTALKSKLDGIAEGAEVNVQSDWSDDNSNSGAYIKNKPTIPAAVTESTVSGWGFYIKPSDGIPQSDLASAVQTSLDKAKNAFTGTVNYKSEGSVVALDKIVMNGVDYTPEGSETHIDIGTVITGDDSVQHILGGLVVGSDETPSAMQDEKHVGRIVLTGVENPLVGLLDNSNGAVPFYLQAYENELYVGQTRGKAIKINSSGNVTVQKALTVVGTVSEGGTALSNKYQAKLVSGTNIKTINNQSILGSGNIVANAYPLVSHGTSDTTFTLTPNTFHVWGIVSSLTLTFGSETEGVANEYLFQFSCSSSVATTLSLPSSVMWANGETPTIEVMKTYQVSILNNCATIQSFG